MTMTISSFGTMPTPPAHSANGDRDTRGPVYEQGTRTRTKTTTHAPDGTGTGTGTSRTSVSPPLRDDFDALTTTETTRRQTQRWSRTTRGTTTGVAALCDQLEAQTQTATRAATPAGPPLGVFGGGVNGTRRGSRQPQSPQAASAAAVELPVPAHPLRRKRRIKPLRAPSSAQGLDYTLIGHRVLEDGPERTVSLSTWREQAVEEEIGGDAMSVYYVRAEDLDWGWGEGIPMAAREEIVIVPFPVRKPPEAVAEEEQESRSPSGRRRRRASGSGSGTETGPHTSTPRGSGTLVPQPPTADVSKKSASAEFRPFHATRSKSGSTISSIHLASPPPPSPHLLPYDKPKKKSVSSWSSLPDILAACDPPLGHLEPHLARVGILRTAHLRAVGRLSDAPRAELRDAVLALGVTLLEWAMLLDRVRGL